MVVVVTVGLGVAVGVRVALVDLVALFSVGSSMTGLVAFFLGVVAVVVGVVAVVVRVVAAVVGVLAVVGGGTGIEGVEGKVVRVKLGLKPERPARASYASNCNVILEPFTLLYL